MGDKFVGHPERRPAKRTYIQVRRSAKDGSWVDVRCFTWAVYYSCRVPNPIPDAIEQHWGEKDLKRQEEDHMLMLEEENKIHHGTESEQPLDSP